MNQLKHQMRELQEAMNSLGESQDFKDLETASRSGSVHASCKTFVCPSFSSQQCRECYRFNRQNLSSLPRDVLDDPALKASTAATFSPAPQAECSKAAVGEFPLLMQEEAVQIDERQSKQKFYGVAVHNISDLQSDKFPTQSTFLFSFIGNCLLCVSHQKLMKLS